MLDPTKIPPRGAEVWEQLKSVPEALSRAVKRLSRWL
jgi:hypothetical protein